MKIQIQSLHFDADNQLLEFIKREVDKLDKVYNRIESCNVILRIDKNSKNQDKLVEINMNIPGIRLFSSDQSDSFEVATYSAINELKQQLIKRKEKISAW